MVNNIYNTLIEKVLLPLGSKITGNQMTKYLHYLRQCDNMSESELIQEQNRKLNSVILNAVNNSPYYKSLNIELSNDPIESLKKFPILTKDILRKESINMLTVLPKGLVKRSSSGSSGISSSTYATKNEIGTTQATQLHWMNWAGYKSGNPIFQTGMTERSSVKKIKDLLFRTHYISAFSLSEEAMANELKTVSNDNSLLVGYASSLYLLAETNAQNNLGIKFIGASSLGDKMFDHYREKIESSFHCKVYDTYGCSEGFMMAATKDIPYYYIMSPNVYIEIVDDFGNEVKDGELGHVLVTNLNAYAMPMLRYKLGDLAIKLPREKYPKDRELNYPLLQKVVGRDTDLVKTISGETLIVHTFTAIFEYEPSVKQFRIIQHTIEGIEIEYIKGEGFDNSVLDRITTKIYNKINDSPEEFSIRWTEVTNIPPTKSGKTQMIKSELMK